MASFLAIAICWSEFEKDSVLLVWSRRGHSAYVGLDMKTRYGKHMREENIAQERRLSGTELTEGA